MLLPYQVRAILACDTKDCDCRLEVGLIMMPGGKGATVFYLPVNGRAMPKSEEWLLEPPSPITGEGKHYCPSHTPQLTQASPLFDFEKKSS